MSKNLLTEDEQHLQLFDDGVSINKNLQKWKNAEEGIEKTEAPKSQNSNLYVVSVVNNDNSSMGTPLSVDSNNDVDSNIDEGTRWLPLYQTPEGLSFDEIAAAGVKDLTRLLVEKKIKYVMAGYGSFGSTATNVEYNNSINPFIIPSHTYGEYQNIDKIKNMSKFKKFLLRIISKKPKEPKPEFDAVKFFSMVKSSSKESAFMYRDRVSTYLKALHNACDMGQTALQEELLKGLVTNKYESLLFAEGYYYVIDEETIVDFIKKCEKGISLDYIKNFARPIPQEVVEKISKLNELEVFDNYVVLHYDPEKTAYKETEYEIAKRKDPIIFGLIAGSKKLYYVTDWIDETCDLTLEKFVDTLEIEKDDLKMSETIV